MEKNEIKKALYKEKPVAKLIEFGKENVYIAELSNGMEIKFIVPVSDMGETLFGKTMEAQLLIRWLFVE